MISRETTGDHKWSVRALGTALSLVLLFAGALSPAYASTEGGVALYISAPGVQGPGVTGSAPVTVIETFNDLPGATVDGASCPSTLAIGTLTETGGQACLLRSVGIYGGAGSTTPDPVFGEIGTNYLGVPSPNKAGAKATFTFPGADVKYVGFWWSAGNPGNTVEFLDASNNVIASLDSQALTDLLGISNTDATSLGTVTAMSGATYPKRDYFGNPNDISTLLYGTGGYDEPYIYVYLNLFLTGDLAAKAVRFGGSGFEFDNLTTSTLAQTPATSLVFVKGLLGKSVQFFPAVADATGSMVAQSSSTTQNLSLNSFRRTGHTFTGWNTQADGNGTPYADGVIYSFATDLDLYAQWELAPAESQSGGSTAVPKRSETSHPELAATGSTAGGTGLLALGLATIGVMLYLATRRGRNTASPPSSL